MKIPMLLVDMNPETDEQTFRVPVMHDGLEITRALGRCCSGDTLVTKQVEWPHATCEIHHSDGKPFLVCTKF